MPRNFASGQKPFGLSCLLCLLFSALPLCAGEGEAYVVRKSDTLSSIARSHGVSVNQLLEANALSRSGHIRVGQRLKIPQTAARDFSPRESSPEGPLSAYQSELGRVR